MWKVHAYRSLSYGKPMARVVEVEPIEYAGRTLYRDVKTGATEELRSWLMESVHDTREAAVEAGRQRLLEFGVDYAAAIAKAVRDVGATP